MCLNVFKIRSFFFWIVVMRFHVQTHVFSISSSSSSSYYYYLFIFITLLTLPDNSQERSQSLYDVDCVGTLQSTVCWFDYWVCSTMHGDMQHYNTIPHLACTLPFVCIGARFCTVPFSKP
jgi:hypothetical protein